MEPSPSKIRGETRCIGKPRDWDNDLDGHCGALSVRDEIEVQSGVNFMHSEWRLQPGELKLLTDHNGVVMLRISGTVHGRATHEPSPSCTGLGPSGECHG